ncbi:MAG TPA: MFS transporter [Deltaproteobacteria bacterium]|nr:MFS transporter [Deltaproteobacteria bacterium]
MAFSRMAAVERQLRDFVTSRPPQPPRSDWSSAVRPGTELRARDALRLFEAQLQSRLLDLIARELKATGDSFYTIGSSGHEGNAAVADALEPGDLCFLHYRSGALFCALADARPGPEGAFDVLLGLVASLDEPIAGGRHKVFGSVPLGILPQTSTIASHIPKAVGTAIALDRRARLQRHRTSAIAVCSFGDASSNHATAQAGLNAAAWATYQRVPVPCLFVCEDNGLGISVRTPSGWVATANRDRPGIEYFSGDGLDLVSAWEAARAAVRWVRTQRRPAFLHLRTVRLLGHAGSDVEQLYRTQEEIVADEALDPLLASAALLIDGGWMQPDEILSLIDELRARLEALAREAVGRPKLTHRAEIVAPLFRHDPSAIEASGGAVASPEARHAAFGVTLPEHEERPRHLAMQLNRALLDVMLAHPGALVFGEDVARKGGVYHVTAGLSEALGVGRVFNTLLDETSILGLAMGAGHAGLLAIPEIQYLAYLMNAIDQLRGEAGSMQFFSRGQLANPMVVRIAGLAYQRGFGGHFHNDNGIAALREIPGILVGCPARPGDGARMLRTLVGAAEGCGRLCVLLEPIALYMMKDLHEPGDGGWLEPYPAPDQILPVGEIGVTGDGTDLCIASYANGLWMSLRVARRLEAEGVRCRVVDLRWLQPVPTAALLPHAEATGHLLVVDECRASSGVADTVVADISEASGGRVRTARVVGADSYIPLGAAADRVLVQEAEIEQAAHRLLQRRVQESARPMEVRP